MQARIGNILLGVWLFISAFLWTHTAAQTTNSWVVGLLAVAFAAIALAVPRARYFNTVLAVWLFFSVWFLPTVAAATIWNHLIVAVVMFILSLAPGGRAPATARTTTERPAETGARF